MTELDQLRELLDEQGIEHRPTNLGIEFCLEGTWCFADESDDSSGLFAGYGFMPWMCCHMKDAEHVLRWCRDAPVREKIVRCKDCKFYTPESMTREERGFGIYENVWEPGGCFNPKRCSTTWDSIAGQMVPVGIDTEPDGFCKWGESKVVDPTTNDVDAEVDA